MVNGTEAQVKVDWRQLRRWNIPESALPQGSVVLYRPPSFWERDRKYIIVAIVLLLPAIGLLWQQARNERPKPAFSRAKSAFG